MFAKNSFFNYNIVFLLYIIKYFIAAKLQKINLHSFNKANILK